MVEAPGVKSVGVVYTIVKMAVNFMTSSFFLYVKPVLQWINVDWRLYDTSHIASITI